jgi:hypothetical protein
LISFLQIPDVPKPSQNVDSIEDWPAELRPSMRKLRQGMDSLCKTSKLTCSALRLRQTAEAVNLSHQIKYRRDVCFSQALTSLVTGLMNRLWCTAPSAAEADETFLKVYTLVYKYDYLTFLKYDYLTFLLVLKVVSNSRFFILY